MPYGQLLNDEQVLKPTSDKRFPLGTLGYTKDGRKFRYAKCGGTALSAHRVVQTAAKVSTGVASDNYFATAPTTNSTVVKIRFLSTKTMVGSTANYYQDGFVFVRAGTGGGEMVRILSHGKMTSTALAGHVMNLAWDSKFKVAPVTTTAVRVGIIQNPYSRVIQGSTLAYTALTGTPLGVTPCAVTAAYYFWLQTGGLATVIKSGTLAIGRNVRLSSAVAGGVQKETTAVGNGVLGKAWIGGSTAESHYAVVKLEVD